ncbi:hypothetical protein [Achromobacter sp. DMS1]|uniref:hypothetical protein n=1 Tax=Achromobacter sp. DMS1 TaxID=1688405 RepID=UPI000A5DFD05|nr:hypothetical protein [Achromobacter sp. DMS1]
MLTGKLVEVLKLAGGQAHLEKSEVSPPVPDTPAKEVPFTLANQNPWGNESKARADALVDAGLLNKQDTETKAMLGNRTAPARRKATFKARPRSC